MRIWFVGMRRGWWICRVQRLWLIWNGWAFRRWRVKIINIQMWRRLLLRITGWISIVLISRSIRTTCFVVMSPTWVPRFILWWMILSMTRCYRKPIFPKVFMPGECVLSWKSIPKWLPAIMARRHQPVRMVSLPWTLCWLRTVLWSMCRKVS